MRWYRRRSQPTAVQAMVDTVKVLEDTDFINRRATRSNRRAHQPLATVGLDCARLGGCADK